MNRYQIASYVTAQQKENARRLANIDGISISAMVAQLIDEAFELNFLTSDTESASADEIYPDNSGGQT